jgi:glutaredoxin
MNPPVIEIFSARMCGPCHEAIDYFKGRGLPVIAREVVWDSAANQWVRDENGRLLLEMAGPVEFVPQICINGRHLRGWKTPEPLIASGEIERLLQGDGRSRARYDSAEKPPAWPTALWEASASPFQRLF